METVAGFPFFPLEMTKKGEVFDEAQVEAASDAVRAAGPDRLSDLVVLSHGWNNDMADARALYGALLGNLRRLLDGTGSQQRIGVLGVFWPSKKFAEEELIPAQGEGGAASLDDGGLPDDRLMAELERLKGSFDQPDAAALDEAKTLVGRLEDSPSARDRFVDLLRGLLPRPADPADDGSDALFDQSGDDILRQLRAPMRLMDGSAGGAAAMGDGPRGGAAGFGDLFSGFKAGAWKLLNFTTYYQMKERAGVVGSGLNGVLAGFRAARPDLRIHLVGHSFGARVVTAAVDGAAALAPASLTLLQGAFSHNGFAQDFDHEGTDGFFRKVVEARKVAGPIVATHTANDKAVGLAYALASRISGDNRAAFGDADDVFGGIGRNGAIHMRPDEAVALELLDGSATYALAPGMIHNMLADGFVSSHSDVANPAVANLVLAAIRS